MRGPRRERAPLGSESPKSRPRRAALARSSRTAFTLIEVMIAITIFSLVLAAIYSTWTMILRATRVAQEAAAQVQRQRIAIGTIEDALTGIEDFQASQKYYSFVMQNGSQATLSFTARLPDDFPRSARFGGLDVRRLEFDVEPISDTGAAGSGFNTENDLVLRQCPLLVGMDQDEMTTPYVLARNVKDFVVEGWDTNQQEWVKEWDTTNSIPPLIRVTLSFGGKNRDNFAGIEPNWSVTRIIAVPSEITPAVVQTGTGAAGGGFGGRPPVSIQNGGVQINGTQ